MNIKEIPKIDLHCHLDGSLTLEMIRRYTGKDVTIDMLSVDNDCQSLTEYLEKFKLPLDCLQDKAGLKEGAYTFLKDVAKDNMRYIEVRFAPMFCIQAGLSCSEVIESAIEGLEKGKKEYGVSYNVIVCAMRNHSLEQNRSMLYSAREYLGSGVCALDLAGDESAYPTKEFIELFKEAKRLDMPYIIHSGETGNIENVRLAYELGARRIGHGIALIKDKHLMTSYANQGIGVEMCPSSNWQTKAIRDWSDYPLKNYMDAGIKVSINTDNRTVSNTTLTKELEIIHDLYKDDELIYRLLKNAQETAFEKDLNIY